MATNFYFNNFNNSQEQLLIENLIIESIKIYGQDMFYIPRTTKSYDALYTEDDSPEYNSAFLVELYIKSIDGFQGDGDFLSKFGLEIRDRVTLTIARRVFSEEIGTANGLIRPREGDLIYFPLNNKIFQIKFVEHEAIFYQLGALQTYDLQCELFEYSNEKFNTGIPQIDELDDPYQNNPSTGTMSLEDGISFAVENGDNFAFENYSQGSALQEENDFFQEQANAFIDFTEIDPFSEGGRF